MSKFDIVFYKEREEPSISVDSDFFDEVGGTFFFCTKGTYEGEPDTVVAAVPKSEVLYIKESNS